MDSLFLKDRYYESLQRFEEQLIEDLAELVAIRSVRDTSTKSEQSPFGKEIRDVFDQMLSFAERDSFAKSDFDGYALHIEEGQGKEIIGILAHLDIVPEGDKNDWDFDPFTLTQYEGHLYGRGVNDDKAPALAAYYALKILRDIGVTFNKRVRLILGGAEETTWECMDHYFKYNEQPAFAFSPDGDFPIVNGEKGVLQGTFYKDNKDYVDNPIHSILTIKSEKQRGFICEKLVVTFKSLDPENLKIHLKESTKIEDSEGHVIAHYEGDIAVSRNPHKGENAIFKLGRDLERLPDNHAFSICNIPHSLLTEDVHGKDMGLYLVDQEMGETTISLPYMLYNEHECEIGFDYRYPKGLSREEIFQRLNAFADENKLQLTIHKEYDPLYVKPDSNLILKLQQAYKTVTGDYAECITKGGISYSRALDNCVAFGPTFENDVPNTHKPNERISIETMRKAIIIYCETIRLLAASK